MRATSASRTPVPPQRSTSARVPVAMRTASEDKRSATISRLPGSPTETSGAPACTGCSLIVPTDSTTPSLGARNSTASDACSSGPTKPACARSNVPSDMAIRDWAAATLASEIAICWVTVSNCVIVDTPRSTSACVRSNCNSAKAISSCARARSLCATSRAASASATAASACARERASSSEGCTGSTRATTVSPAITASPTATGARCAVPAMGEATS